MRVLRSANRSHSAQTPMEVATRGFESFRLWKPSSRPVADSCSKASVCCHISCLKYHAASTSFQCRSAVHICLATPSLRSIQPFKACRERSRAHVNEAMCRGALVLVGLKLRPGHRSFKIGHHSANMISFSLYAGIEACLCCELAICELPCFRIIT